jgi:hypothetical protein
MIRFLSAFFHMIATSITPRILIGGVVIVGLFASEVLVLILGWRFWKRFMDRRRIALQSAKEQRSTPTGR